MPIRYPCVHFLFPGSVHNRHISPETINGLGNRLKQGNAFIGSQGSINGLIISLGLPESDDQTQSSDIADSYVEFAYPKDDGTREGMILELSTTGPDKGLQIGQIWTGISGWSSGLLDLDGF